MKLFIALILFSGVLAQAEHAISPIMEQPLLSYSTSSGFVNADQVSNKTCNIFKDRIEVTEQIGELFLKVTKTALVSENVIEMIDQVMVQPAIDIKRGPTDIGLVVYRAFKFSSNADLKSADLKFGGQLNGENDSRQAQMLIRFINVGCEIPQTNIAR